GLESGVFIAIGCVVSYLFSGHSGIYSAQRIGLSKYSAIYLKEGMTLGTYRREKVEPKIDLPDDGEEEGSNSQE
ncbi:MAG: chloride channel protein, partial [Nostoc sp.]